MKSKPRICVTCGTTYEYCPKCTKDADKPVWMVAFHTEECRKVYNIIAKYNTGDVTHKTRFTKPIQDKVNEIMKEEQPKAKTKKIVTEN